MGRWRWHVAHGQRGPGQRTGDAQPVFEVGLDAHFAQPRVDLRAAAVHEHGLDADAGEQHEVVDDACLERRVLHGRAAVLDDDRAAAELLQVGQRLGEDRDAVEVGGARGLHGSAFWVDSVQIPGEFALLRNLSGVHNDTCVDYYDACGLCVERAGGEWWGP